MMRLSGTCRAQYVTLQGGPVMTARQLKMLFGTLVLANLGLLVVGTSPEPVAADSFCTAQYCVCWGGNTWIPGGCHNNAAEDDQCSSNEGCGLM